MKTISNSLKAILASSQFFVADCYTFHLIDGTTLRYTTADQSLTDSGSGNVFTAAGPFFSRSKLKFKVGVEVDQLQVVISARSTDSVTTNGPFWLQALVAGQFDGAEMQLDRAFMPTFGDTTAGLVTLFYGRVTEVEIGRSGATLKVNTHLELLNLKWPWRLFQPGCSRSLFDSGCTLVKSSFGIGYHVQAGSTARTVQTDCSAATGWATLGTVTFTSGALSGKSYAVQSQTGGVLQMLTPLPTVPANGDAITLYPGCDKQQSTCLNKFSNLQHFEGFPYVPVPETAA